MNRSDDQLWTPESAKRSQLSRRDVFRIGGATLLGVGAASVLSACSSSGSAVTPTGAASSAGTPKKGGTLTVGISGGAASDTLDPHNPLTTPDFARISQIYEPLVTIGDGGAPTLVLLESLTPNADGSEWTMVVKKGVKLHDGKTFGAKDVLWNLQRIVTNKFPGLVSLGPIDIANSKVVDDLTVKVAFSKPYSILETALTVPYFFFAGVDFDIKKPVGTGPFKLESFTPGQQSAMVRFADYRDPEKPYLDKIVIQNMADETAQSNALQAGQVQAINAISSTTARTLDGSGKKVLVSETGGWLPFTMRVDTAPFSDVRVRQALRLTADRQQFLDILYGGKGKIGNDVFGIYDAAYDTSLPQRQRDVSQAKSLLASARHSDLQLELIVTDTVPAMPKAAQLFATQLQDAGVQAKVTFQPATDYFAKSYLSAPFSSDWWYYVPYLANASQATIPGAPFSATHFNDPQYGQLFNEAVATTDNAKQTDLIHQMMKIDYDTGGNIIPFFYPQIDGMAGNLNGLTPNVSGQSLGNWDFKSAWLS